MTRGRRRDKELTEQVTIPAVIMETAMREAHQVLRDNIGSHSLDHILAYIWVRGAIQGGIVILDAEERKRGGLLEGLL